MVFVTTRDAPVSQNGTDLVMKVISDRTEDTLISEMSKFEAEESEKGVNRQIGVKVV